MSHDDRRLQDWLQAVDLRRRLLDAVIDRLCWWRDPGIPSKRTD